MGGPRPFLGLDIIDQQTSKHCKCYFYFEANHLFIAINSTMKICIKVLYRCLLKHKAIFYYSNNITIKI